MLNAILIAWLVIGMAYLTGRLMCSDSTYFDIGLNDWVKFIKEKTMPTENNELSLFDLKEGVSYEAFVSGTPQKNKFKIVDGQLHRWGGSRSGYTTDGVHLPANATFKEYSSPHTDEGDEFYINEVKDGLVYKTSGTLYIARKGNKIYTATSDKKLGPPSNHTIPLDETLTCIGRLRS